MKYTLAAVLVLCMAMPAMAVLGLPIADDGQSEPGMMRVSGGVTLESDMNMYGARFTYGINEELAVFGGAGLFDPDGADSEPYFQLGATYGLNQFFPDLPLDLAVRAAFGLVSFDESGGHGGYSWKAELDIWTLNVGLLGSKQIEMVKVYGLAGFSYQKFSFDYTESGPWGRETYSGSDNETELAIAAGVIYPLNDQVSFYGELAYIDEMFISLGARYQF